MSDLQLNLTEKGLRKMLDMSKSYRHALLNADVLDTFKVPCTVCTMCSNDSYVWSSPGFGSDPEGFT